MFKTSVSGLVRLPYAFDGTGSGSAHADIVDLETHATQPCFDFFEGADVTCPGSDSDTAEFSVALSGFFTAGADYYAVTAAVWGPVLRGTSCIDRTTVTDPGPCHIGGPWMIDGEVSGGDYVRVDTGDPGYVSVDPTYSVDTPPTSVGWPLPATRGTAFLVNPAPTWPVPDGEGNEFGRCLFTLAQLPAAITFALTYFDYDQQTGGSLRVAVTAYMIGEEEDPPATEVRHVCIVGCA